MALFFELSRIENEESVQAAVVAANEEIKQLKEQGRTLAEIARVLVLNSDDQELPEPLRSVIYPIADDVAVHIDAGVSPHRHRQIRDALLEFASAVGTTKLPENNRPQRQSVRYSKLFDELGIGYFLKGKYQIDNNKALRFAGKSIRVYFNEATQLREAYFALNESFYANFEWQNWRNVEVSRSEQSHAKKIPLEGREAEAFEELIDYLKEQRPDLYTPD